METPKLLPIQQGARDAMRSDLYQVMVTVVATGERRLVMPAVMEEAAGMFCEAIQKKIATGREREWADPVVMLVPNTIN